MKADLLNEYAGCGRLDRPPHDCCYIDLPNSFGRRFLIFCDTEEEFDWSRPVSRDNRAVTHMKSLPDLHRHFREQGATPVYLIDHPIASDPYSTTMLREWLEAGECTIGTQLHPWVNPPFDEEVNVFNSFAGNLPRALEKAKLLALSETIEQAVGRRPTVYRAGRYGVGACSADLLREAGYQVDVSVRALYDYSDEGGPNFSRVVPRPFWVGDGDLLEIPLTAAFTGGLARYGRGLYPLSGKLPFVRGGLSRAGLLGRIAFSPEQMPIGEVLEAARRLLDQDFRLFSISFHSPSVEPGHTPYVRDKEDLRTFHAWWDYIFEFFARHSIAPASIDEVLEAARATRTDTAT